jgi:hypothetical protein
LIRGRFFEGPTGESLIQHYGVQVRCLVVIPLFILGEMTLHKSAMRYIPQFIGNGLVEAATRPRFEAAVHAVRRWRDSSLPWVLVVGTALTWTLVNRAEVRSEAMSWALDEEGALGFGGLWFAYVVRLVFLGLLLGWLWRIALLTMLFVRLGWLGLSLVPTHPDGAGGLGFLEKLPLAFAPVTFGLSAMLASRWAHDLVYHGQTLDALKVPAAMFVITWSLLLLAPLVALTPVLHATKRAALPSYAAMAAEQGRQVRRKWIDGTTKAEAPLLEPAGIGPIADTATMFNAVRSMRIVLIGKASLVGIALPIALPMLVVTALQIPLPNLLLDLIKALI